MQKDQKPKHVLTTFLSVFCFVLGRLGLFCFFSKQGFSVALAVQELTEVISLSLTTSGNVFVVFILFYFSFWNVKESQTSQVAHS